MASFLKWPKSLGKVSCKITVSGTLPRGKDPGMKSHSPELSEKDTLEKIAS